MIEIKDKYVAGLILDALRKERKYLSQYVETKNDAALIKGIINEIENIYYSLPELNS